MSNKEYKDYVDEVIYYRNLAITLGAKPEQMLNEYDKALCSKGIDPNDNSGGYCWSVSESIDEIKDLWSKVDELEQEIKLLKECK